MAKQILYSEDGRMRLKAGVDKLANAVRVTLGPKGKTVILSKKFGSPTIIDDGVTIAKEIELEDHFEDMGAQLVREAASKTNDVAGDGTTTATVLTQATDFSMPDRMAMGLAPAATFRSPSFRMAWARTVAVVVPSPATSWVFVATSFTS